MTRDIIIGVVVSLALHLLILFGDKLIPEKKTVKKVEEAAPKIEMIAMPKVEEEPEIIETNDPDIKPLDLAPPMQQDVPQLVQPDSFVQKIQDRKSVV